MLNFASLNFKPLDFNIICIRRKNSPPSYVLHCEITIGQSHTFFICLKLLCPSLQSLLFQVILISFLWIHSHVILPFVQLIFWKHVVFQQQFTRVIYIITAITQILSYSAFYEGYSRHVLRSVWASYCVCVLILPPLPGAWLY